MRLCILGLSFSLCFSFFFFTYPAPTEIYTLSLHDALPISTSVIRCISPLTVHILHMGQPICRMWTDRKSTRLNSSHRTISYAVFCLKKKKKKKKQYKKKTNKTNKEHENNQYNITK